MRQVFTVGSMRKTNMKAHRWNVEALAVHDDCVVTGGGDMRVHTRVCAAVDVLWTH